MMHRDNQYEYYKVTVAQGTKMIQGKVYETCKPWGMKAVCNGPGRTCHYDNFANCYVTPLSDSCGNPM